MEYQEVDSKFFIIYFMSFITTYFLCHAASDIIAVALLFNCYSKKKISPTMVFSIVREIGAFTIPEAINTSDLIVLVRSY